MEAFFPTDGRTPTTMVAHALTQVGVDFDFDLAEMRKKTGQWCVCTYCTQVECTEYASQGVCLFMSVSDTDLA